MVAACHLVSRNKLQPFANAESLQSIVLCPSRVDASVHAVNAPTSSQGDAWSVLAVGIKGVAPKDVSHSAHGDAVSPGYVLDGLAVAIVVLPNCIGVVLIKSFCCHGLVLKIAVGAGNAPAPHHEGGNSQTQLLKLRLPVTTSDQFIKSEDVCPLPFYTPFF